MRFIIQNKELEFRVQERRITVCSVFHKGKEIASDLAIHAPQDPYDQREGERIAVERVAQILYEHQQKDRQMSMETITKAFEQVGALSGNVELPKLEEPRTIIDKVMAKLDARRERKLKETMEKEAQLTKAAAAHLKTFHEANPNLFAGIPAYSSPYLRPRTAFILGGGRSLFGLNFGIDTKPSGR